MNRDTQGIVAYFDSPKRVLEAAYASQRKGMEDYESYTPFPVHGMEKALGLKHSCVPWATLVCGLMGFLAAHALQIWTSAINWPLNVGGKPMVSYPAFIPIIFELTVLFGGLGTVAFLFYIIGIPTKKKPLHPKLTDDYFALYIPISDKNGTEEEIKAFLSSLNVKKISIVTESP